jgi:hypothetical protein
MSSAKCESSKKPSVKKLRIFAEKGRTFEAKAGFGGNHLAVLLNLVMALVDPSLI